MLGRILATDNEKPNLILRLALGCVMFPHGAQKLLGWYGRWSVDRVLSATLADSETAR